MGTSKAPAVDLLKLNTPRDTKTTFFTPKRNDEHHPFYMGVTPWATDDWALLGEYWPGLESMETSTWVLIKLKADFNQFLLVSNIFKQKE